MSRAQKCAVAASLLGAVLALATPAAAQRSVEDLGKQFLSECRNQFSQSPSQSQDVSRLVRECVQERMKAVGVRGLAPNSVPGETRTAGEFRLFEFTPWLVKNRGPDKAKGVVYFILGWDLRPTLNSVQLTPYFFKSLSENGWDIVAAKVPQELPRQEALDTGRLIHYPAISLVSQRIKALRARGYRRVVLAGHSWGGRLSMLAAQDRSLGADALILSAPSYGSKKQRDGKPNPYFERNFTEYPRLVNGIKVPTVLLLYAQDDENPPGRGDVAKRGFEQNKLPHLIIDQPAGLNGHFAGWLPLYDYLFGGCIQSFLEKPKTDVCNLSPITNSDFRSILNLKQVADAESKRITSVEPLVGKRFAVHSLGLFLGQLEYVTSTRRERRSLINERTEYVSARDGLHCFIECRILVRWSDREILEFVPESGDLSAWWIEY